MVTKPPSDPQLRRPYLMINPKFIMDASDDHKVSWITSDGVRQNLFSLETWAYDADARKFRLKGFHLKDQLRLSRLINPFNILHYPFLLIGYLRGRRWYDLYLDFEFVEQSSLEEVKKRVVYQVITGKWWRGTRENESEFLKRMAGYNDMRDLLSWGMVYGSYPL